MKPSSNRESKTTSPSKLRNALMLVLGMSVGVVGTCHFDGQNAKQERERMEEVLGQKDSDLKECRDSNKQADKQLRRTKMQLAQVTAAKERLNDWQTFLKGLREKDVEQLEAEGDLAGQCRDLKDKEAEARAIKMLDFYGITNEADRQAILDSIMQGCTIDGFGSGKAIMEPQVDLYCENIDLETTVDKEHVDLEQYEKGSDAERTAMDHLRDKDYQGALDAYEPVMNELEAMLEANPAIQDLPFFDDAKKQFQAVYDAFRKGNTLEGICQIGIAAKVLKDFDESPALLALIDTEGGDFEDILRKLELFGNIIKAKGDQDYPEFKHSSLDSPEMIEACAKIGVDITQ